MSAIQIIKYLFLVLFLTLYIEKTFFRNKDFGNCYISDTENDYPLIP